MACTPTLRYLRPESWYFDLVSVAGIIRRSSPLKSSFCDDSQGPPLLFRHPPGLEDFYDDIKGWIDTLVLTMSMWEHWYDYGLFKKAFKLPFINSSSAWKTLQNRDFERFAICPIRINGVLSKVGLISASDSHVLSRLYVVYILGIIISKINNCSS